MCAPEVTAIRDERPKTARSASRASKTPERISHTSQSVRSKSRLSSLQEADFPDKNEEGFPEIPEISPEPLEAVDEADVVKNFEDFMESSAKALQMADEMVAVEALDKEQFQSFLEKYFESTTTKEVIFCEYLHLFYFTRSLLIMPLNLSFNNEFNNKKCFILLFFSLICFGRSNKQ